MKKIDVVVVAAYDDEVRNSASHNHTTATLCTEEFFFRTHYTVYSSSRISAERCGGQDIDGQCHTYRQSWLSFRSKPNVDTAEQGL